MNRYNMQNAAEKIDDYMTPRPNETVEKAFERAKAETILAYESYIKDIKELSLDKFIGEFPRYRQKQ